MGGENRSPDRGCCRDVRGTSHRGTFCGAGIPLSVHWQERRCPKNVPSLGDSLSCEILGGNSRGCRGVYATLGAAGGLDTTKYL